METHYAKTHSAIVYGVSCTERKQVTIEVSIVDGIGIHVIGLQDITAKETMLRTITALNSIGYNVPGKKIVVNIWPGDLKKDVTNLDLPIALAILAADGKIQKEKLDKFMASGELGLDGSVRMIKDPILICDYCLFESCDAILPLANKNEVKKTGDCKPYFVRNLQEAIELLK